MIFSKIWERLIFKQIFLFFIFTLFCLYATYVIIDFSTHSTRLFTYSDIKFYKIIIYYLHHFIIRLNLLLPLTFMLAIIKVLSDMNAHNEITALNMAGLSFIKILRPFFILAFFLITIGFLVEEFSTKSLIYVDTFKDKHLKKPSFKKKEDPIKTLLLDDNSKIIFQKFNHDENRLFDIFWIKTDNDLWHIKYLYIKENYLLAKFVDTFYKNEKNIFEKKDSFRELKINQKLPPIIFSKGKEISADNDSILSLCSLLKEKKYSSAKHHAIIKTYLNYKLVKPLFPLLMLIGISPMCMKFSRNKLSMFFITSLSIVGFIFYITILDSMVILGENQILFGGLLIWLPFIISMLIFGYFFVKTQNFFKSGK